MFSADIWIFVLRDARSISQSPSQPTQSRTAHLIIEPKPRHRQPDRAADMGRPTLGNATQHACGPPSTPKYHASYDLVYRLYIFIYIYILKIK